VTNHSLFRPLLWLILTLAAVWVIFTQVTLRSDLSLFLPTAASEMDTFLLKELNEGHASKLLLIAIEDGTEEQRAEVSRQLTVKLRQNKLFSRVENGVYEVDNSTYPLFRYRYLLSPRVNSETFSTENLTQALTTRLRELHTPLPPSFKALLTADPTMEYRQLANHWLPKLQPFRSHGVWSSEDGTRALLVAETLGSGLDINDQQAAVTAIEKNFSALDAGNQLTLRISGPGAFAVQSRSLIKNETRNLSMAASAGILLILFLAYRSASYLLYVSAPLLSAMIAGTITTHAAFGELHGITLAFGITLLGVCVDYPIHLFSHLRPGEAPKITFQRIWHPLRLGVISTCIGYLILITTEYDGLRQLGVFTVSGLLTAALVSRWVLPDIVRSPRHALRSPDWLARQLRPHPGLSIFLIFIAIALALPIGYKPGALWQDDITTLSPISTEMISLDREIRSQLQAPETNQLILITGNDLESVLKIDEQLNQLLDPLVADGLIGGYVSASQLLPSKRTQLQRRAQLPGRKIMENRLATALTGLPFNKSAFNDFIDDLVESRTLAPITLYDIQDTPPGIILSGMLRQQANGWLIATPLSRVQDAEAIVNRLEQLPSARYVNLSKETGNLVGKFRKTVLDRVVWGVLIMLLVLTVGLKSIQRALKTISPVILALVITIEILYVLGENLNLFHLISLLLVLGIGMDYSLFFSRFDTNSRERLSTLHALIICAASSICVFGLLGSSDIPVLHSIGVTVATGVAVTFIATFSLSRHRTGQVSTG
jgi:predicted exporter